MIFQSLKSPIFTETRKSFFEYVYFALFFLTILIIVLSIYHKKVSQTYIVDENSISISGLSQQLSAVEISVLSLFSKNRIVLNSNLMELFMEDDKTKDYAVKRKNKTLVSLDAKLKKSFNIDFIKKQKSKDDSRQLAYSLNKKLRIIKEIIE